MANVKSDVIRLRHILDASQKATRFTKGKTRADLDIEEQLSLALARLIEIIGEAAAKVSQEIQKRHSSIPWKEMIGTRHRLIHGYEAVNLDVVWQIVSSDLPLLIVKLQTAIEQEERNE
ncbi:MAG: DUF86 domain-containing protein [Ignavibacteriales bacterium]|nr:DUF86 domain-containing protein [Ignavibacteriales bacterium]MBI3787211.1 DUF86 domain-containing protein [Ignavibacteriales bacterium]